nr:carbohydrate-binding domain-containing protein [Lachnospiraceae bacterium]
MNKNRKKQIAAAGMAIALAGATVFTSISASAATNASSFGPTQMNQGQMNQMNQNQMMQGQMNQNVTYASSPTTIVTSTVTNTAKDLTADESNATTITMSDSNNEVKIKAAGTYIVTGNCSDGNITVTKGTTGVVLILKDLDLTSSTGATVSVNKTAEAKIIIQGTVTLTDNEDPADEESTDADVADAYDGAALKAKDGSNVCLTGTGTLNIKGTAKNGIKVGDADSPSFIIDGSSLKVNITATNDGINAGYDFSILSGTVTV